MFNNASEQVLHDNLVAAGVPSEVIREAKTAGLDWKAILSFLIKFGVEGLSELVQLQKTATSAGQQAAVAPETETAPTPATHTATHTDPAGKHAKHTKRAE